VRKNHLPPGVNLLYDLKHPQYTCKNFDFHVQKYLRQRSENGKQFSSKVDLFLRVMGLVNHLRHLARSKGTRTAGGTKNSGILLLAAENMKIVFDGLGAGSFDFLEAAFKCDVTKAELAVSAMFGKLFVVPIDIQMSGKSQLEFAPWWRIIALNFREMMKSTGRSTDITDASFPVIREEEKKKEEEEKKKQEEEKKKEEEEKKKQEEEKKEEGVMDEGVMDEGVMDEGVMDEGVMDEGVMEEGEPREEAKAMPAPREEAKAMPHRAVLALTGSHLTTHTPHHTYTHAQTRTHTRTDASVFGRSVLFGPWATSQAGSHQDV
jgi:hypothetical protein